MVFKLRTNICKILILSILASFFTSCEKTREAYNPQGFADLHGHTICVMEGSMQQDYALKHLNDTSTHFVSFNSATDCMAVVNQGKADAFFASTLFAYNDAFRRQHLKMACTIDEMIAPVAIGFKKGNNVLTNDYNAFQDSLQKCGALQEILERWQSLNNSDYHNCVVIPPVPDEPDTKLKVLRVGISGVTPPYEVLIDNQWTGIEIELMQRYAASRGMAISVESFELANLIPALQTDKIDVAASVLAISDERKAKINFGHIYTFIKAALIVADPDATSDKSFIQGLKESIYYSLVCENRWELLVDGFWITLLISVSALIIGLILGGIICWLTMHKITALRIVGKTYLYLVRNIPMLVLLMLMFYVILAYSGLPTVMIAIIAFGMNCAAYVSEIYRTGIQSVDPGQREAGLALGFSPLQTFFYFIAPQAIHKAAPVLKNEAVSLLKGTAIVGYISIIDLTKASDLIRSSSFEAFIPLLVISVVYFFLAWLFTAIIDFLIKRI